MGLLFRSGGGGWVGGWLEIWRVKLISTQVIVEVEVGVELGNMKFLPLTSIILLPYTTYKTSNGFIIILESGGNSMLIFQKYSKHIDNKELNKLVGLSWAKLSSIWDLTLLYFFENLLSLNSALEWKKIIRWSPLWIIFKGKIKIARLLPERSARQYDHFLQT